MREIRFAAVGLLAAGLGFGAIAQVPAKAASWHNGTPKVLRHTWRGYGKTQWYNWKFSATKIKAWNNDKSAGDYGSSEYWKNVKYKKTNGKTYKLTGFAGKTKDRFTVKVSGSTVQVWQEKRDTGLYKL
ncbi:hypothetical protein [Lentilactobacillus kisonensis]|nr:hypothetical protein [Lentilactobacillus kisonensis]